MFTGILMFLGMTFGNAQIINTFPWTEDFENSGNIPAGWVNEASNSYDWNFSSNETSSGGAISDDHTLVSGYFAYFNSYSASTGSVGELTSPVIDLSSLTNPVLEFYFQRPGNTSYNARLEINVFANGVWNNDLIPNLDQQTSDWTLQTLDLTPYIASDAKIQFKVVSDWYRNFGLDDVKIYQPTANDAAINAIVSPALEFAVGTQNVIAELKNSGTADLTSTTIDWSVGGVAQTAFNWTGTLTKGATEQVMLGSYDFSTGGSYTIAVSSSLPNGVADENAANDAASIDVLAVAPISVFPYIEDFENAGSIPDGWKNAGDNTYDWKFDDYVSSSGSYFGSDHTTGSGFFAYFDSYYASANKIGKLNSPILDLSALSNASLEFYYDRDKSGYADRLEVNVLSNGVWYNDIATGLDQQTSGWTQVKIDLTTYISSNVQIQFKVVADDRNIAIDDVKIYEPDPMSVSSTTTTQTAGNIILGTNQQVIGIEVTTAGELNPVSVSNFALSTNGTTNAADISNARLYYTGSDAVYNTDVQYGADVPNPSGAFAVSGTQALVEGLNYFWLVYDINEVAAEANLADAECSAITISGSDYTPVILAPEGSMTIERKVNMPSGTGNAITACDFVFYDDGGASASYSNSFDGEITFYPSTPGDLVRIDFTSFASYYGDTISIYNGNSTAAPVILDRYGNTTTNPGSFESRAADGSLTVRFQTTSSSSRSGWEASVSCFTPSDMTFASATTTQAMAVAELSTINNNVIGIQVETTGELNPLNLNSFSLSTNGTIIPADISNARIWYTGSDNAFATTTQFGADLANPNGAFEIAGTQTLERGMNYFWLTYDISANAKSPFADAECLSVTVDVVAQTPTVTAPENMMIIDKVLSLPSGTTTVTNCGITITDDGGLTGNYSDNFTGEIEIRPETPGDIVKLEFSEFNVYYSDYLNVYDGTSATGTKLNTGYSGLSYGDTPGIYECTSGSFLTLSFETSSSTNRAGWTATTTCYTPLPMIYENTVVTQTVDEVITGETNAQIIGFEVKTVNKLDPLELSSFIFNTEGTTDAADITAARLYYTGTDNVFATGTQFGLDVLTPNGELILSGTQKLAEGSNYFWLVYDIAETTTSGNLVDATCTGITIGGEIKTPSVTAPIGNRAVVQKVLMPTEGAAEYTTCNAVFYDDGGVNGNYSSSVNSTVTFYPATPGDAVQIDFTYFNFYNSDDEIYIYSGNSVDAPQIGNYYGSGPSPVGSVIQSTALDGSLTIQFVSNSTGVDPGWVANVSCYTPEDMQYVSSTITQNSGTIPLNGYSNCQIIGLEVVTTGLANPMELTDLVFNTTGTTDAADLKSARVYYTETRDVFVMENQFGADFANPNGEFTISGSRTLNHGTNYFWLVYELNENAIVNNRVDAECTSVKVASFPLTPVVTTVEGSRPIADFVAMLPGTGYEATVCNTKFYDDGIKRVYTSNFDGVTTLYPASAESTLKIDFVEMDIQPNSYSSYYDYLNIYEGNQVITNNETAKIAGSELPASLVSTAADGSFTFEFHTNSTYSQTYKGWEANISCVSTVARLSDLLMGGATIPGFDANLLEYTFDLRNSEVIPEITFVQEHDAANVSQTNAEEPLPSVTTIIVTAEDNIHINNYKVFFNRLPKLSDATLSMIKVNGEDLAGFTAEQLTYNVELPYGTTEMPLVGYTVNDSYASATQNDVTVLPGATTIDVTAEDGTVQQYVVNFTIAKNFDATLSDILKDDVSLNGFASDVYEYTIEMPFGTTIVPVITATTTDAKASANITPATDVPGVTTIVVTAENGTTELVYTVNFTEAAGATDATLSDILKDDVSLNGFASDLYEYTIEMPFGTTVVPVITATTTDVNATAVISPATDVPGVTTIVVTAENGTKDLVYTVNFTEAAGGADASLNDLLIDGITLEGFAFDVYDYNVVLPYGSVDVPVVTYVVNDEKAVDLQINAESLPGTTSIEVTAENGIDKNIYNINFIVAKNNVATLSDLTIDGTTVANFASDVYEYTYELPYGSTEVPVVAYTLSDVNATAIPSIATELPGITTIEVFAENGETILSYTVNFTVAPNNDATLSNLTIADVAVEGFAADVYEYSVELPYGTTEVPVVAYELSDANATAVPTFATELPGITTVAVTAEDGETKLSYSINFTVAPNTDATLSDLAIAGVTVVGFTADVYEYSVELPYGTTEVPVVTYELSDANATAVPTFATELPGITTVAVTAEDGETKLSYSINFTVAKNTDATLSDLAIAGVTVVGFTADVYEYSVELPYGTTEVPVVTYELSDVNANAVPTFATELPGITTVAVTAEDGETKLSYSINFTVAPNTDATLSNLTIADVAVEGFAADVYEYNVELPYGTTEVPVVAYVLNDVNATAIPSIATDLPGTTTIEVIAEDSETILSYSIHFTVAKNNDATLKELMVDGVAVESFAADVYAYSIVLPYGTKEVPVVTCNLNDENATYAQVDATELPGNTSIEVTAENGDTKLTYTVEFTVELNSENEIVSFEFDTFDPVVTGDIDQENLTISMVVPAGTDITTLAPVIEVSAEATVSPASGDVQDFTNAVVYTVTAENGEENLYTVDVTVETGVDEMEDAGISLYPNPVSNLMYISNSKQIGLKKINIYNASGILVMTKDLSGELNEVNMSELTSGMYVIVIESNSKTLSRRFIKQ